MRDIFDATFTTLYGDISRVDAIELADVSRKSKNIMEFGIGGSSYIIHQNAAYDTRVLHIETVGFWNDYVKEHLREVVPKDVYRPPVDYKFLHVEVELAYGEGLPHPSLDPNAFDFVKSCPSILSAGLFDFIFVDGIEDLRYAFATQVWKYLAVRGSMMIHDCKSKWISNILNALIADHYSEIDSITIGKRHSNMMVITKGEYREYYDWNIIEAENNRRNPAVEEKMFE